MIEVHVGGDLHPNMSRSGHALDDGFDALARAVLEAVGRLLLVRGGGFGAGLLFAAGQQIALVVDDGDASGIEPLHGGGDQMLDGVDLLAPQHAARLDDDGAARVLRLARKELALGDDEMDARRGDTLDGLDGAGELALQRPQLVDVLHEGGGAEGVGLVEDLVADAGGGQVVARQLHAQLGDLVGRHGDGAAVALGFVGHVHGVELGGDGGGIARLKAGEQDRLGRLGDDAGHIKEERGQRGGHTGHHAETRGADTFEKFGQTQSPA